MGEVQPFFGATQKESKETLFGLIGYKPYADPVRRVHLSTSRYLVARAMARTSKSYSGYAELMHSFFPRIYRKGGTGPRELDDGEVVNWVVGTRYETCKEWDYFWERISRNEFELPRAFGGRVTTKTNSKHQGNMLVVVEWGQNRHGETCKTVMQGMSSTNEISLQGEEVRLCVPSESAEHEERIFTKYLKPRCERVFFPTTPKRSGLWLYNMVERGEAEEIVYTRECNPKYDYERYEDAKRASAARYGDHHLDDEFMEQFEGEWRFHEGKVLPFRWIEGDRIPSHVIDRDPSWLRYARYAVSFDYGYTEPAVALLWALGPDEERMIVDELYESYLVDQELVRKTRDFVAAHRATPYIYIPDPQRPELTRVLRDAGLPLFTAMPSSRLRDRAASGVALASLLHVDRRTNEPRLKIHARCKRLINEWKALRRKEDVADEWSRQAIIGDDHAFDAARYGALALSGHRGANDEQRWYDEFSEGVRARAVIAARNRGYSAPLEVRAYPR